MNNWLAFLLGMAVGIPNAVIVFILLSRQKGNPPTNWRGEEPYEDD